MEKQIEENASSSEDSLDYEAIIAQRNKNLSNSNRLHDELNINQFFEIDDSSDNYVIQKNVGNGAYASVYSAKRLKDDKLVAIKQMEKIFLTKV